MIYLENEYGMLLRKSIGGGLEIYSVVLKRWTTQECDLYRGADSWRISEADAYAKLKEIKSEYSHEYYYADVRRGR